MGRMSDYDIRPKPKVWAGSPNECRTFGRTSAECCVPGETTSFTGERTERPENVVVSKHVNTHASSDMAKNYVEKLQRIVNEQK